MTITRLILRELFYRRINSLLGLFAMTAAVACLVGTMAVLQGHDVETAQILESKKEHTIKLNEEYATYYRKTMREVSFNVFIVPKDVDPAKLYEAGLGGQHMPQSYVHKLAEADILTIDHLLPSLSAPVIWPEQKNAQVILTGIHGEVAIGGRKRKRPLIQPVGPGQIVLGSNVAKRTGLKKDDQTKFLGRDVTVHKVHSVRGTHDDNTVWIDLTAAQELLNMEGKINAIQAMNCLAEDCYPDETGIPAIDKEVARVLPDTQVLVDIAKAKSRIDVRRGDAARAVKALADEKVHREEMKGQIMRVTSILVPLVIVGAGVWIALMLLSNLRDRRSEIGILRALGVKAKAILAVFLGKALVLGIAGAIIGSIAGLVIGMAYTNIAINELIEPSSLLLIFLAAPLLAIIASWIPAMLAAQQDPAVVLSEE